MSSASCWPLHARTQVLAICAELVFFTLALLSCRLLGAEQIDEDGRAVLYLVRPETQLTSEMLLYVAALANRCMCVVMHVSCEAAIAGGGSTLS
jgi:hypothetical protein